MSQINILNFNQETNFDLSKISPLKIQKIAETVYIPKDINECEKLIKYLISQKKNYYILGNISNSIICPDNDDKITQEKLEKLALKRSIEDLKMKIREMKNED